MEKNQQFVPFSVKLFLTIFVFITMFVLSMILGAADISVSDVWKAIVTNANGDKILIIHEIRLPREIGSAFLGVLFSFIIVYLLSYRKNEGFQSIRLVLIGVDFLWYSQV